MTKSEWIIPFATGTGDGGVLFALGHAGSGAAALRAVCQALAATGDVVAIRMPGRERRIDEQPLTNVADLADHIATEIREFAQGRPIRLFGHCSGAILLYEAALRLDSDQIEVLVVSAQESPSALPVRATWQLGSIEFFRHVACDGYMPPMILEDDEMREAVEPALRADYRAIETYRSDRKPLHAPIVALRGARDANIARGDVEAWVDVAGAAFQYREIDGGHDLLLHDVDALAAAIVDAIDQR